jgi:phage tail-like protein
VNGPIAGFRFFVTLDPADAYVPPARVDQLLQLVVGAFSDVTGLNSELEFLPQPEGGSNDFVHQLPVRHTWGRITLKRGITRDRSLWDWYQESLEGRLGARRDGAIVLLDANGVPAITWEFRAGMAAKWTGPDLAAREASVALESLEIAHHGVNQVRISIPDVAGVVAGLSGEIGL